MIQYNSLNQILEINSATPKCLIAVPPFIKICIVIDVYIVKLTYFDVLNMKSHLYTLFVGYN